MVKGVGARPLRVVWQTGVVANKTRHIDPALPLTALVATIARFLVMVDPTKHLWPYIFVGRKLAATRSSEGLPRRVRSNKAIVMARISLASPYTSQLF